MLVQESVFVADDGNAQGGEYFAVLVVHLGDRAVEPALDAPDRPLDDTPLLFERGDTL